MSIPYGPAQIVPRLVWGRAADEAGDLLGAGVGLAWQIGDRPLALEFNVHVDFLGSRGGMMAAFGEGGTLALTLGGIKVLARGEIDHLITPAQDGSWAEWPWRQRYDVAPSYRLLIGMGFEF